MRRIALAAILAVVFGLRAASAAGPFAYVVEWNVGAVVCRVPFPSRASRADAALDDPGIAAPAFGVMDVSSGSFTPIGPWLSPFSALAYFHSSLYTADSAGTLYHVDPSSGQTTAIGISQLPAFSAPVIAGNGYGLYELAIRSMDLYAIDPASAAATRIGPTGIPAPNFSCQISPAVSLAGWGHDLYAVVQSSADFTDSLYRIDIATGHATMVSPVTGASGITALAVVGGSFFGFADQAFQIDPETGVASPVSSPDSVVYGAADISISIAVQDLTTGQAVLTEGALAGGDAFQVSIFAAP